MSRTYASILLEPGVNPLNPRPTPFDICWRMFGIHVRVSPGFWLFSAAFGYFTGFAFENQKFEISYLAAWIVCSFISVLIHELGHVMMGRLCGQKGNIVLQTFGGAAIGQYQLCNRWQQMAIALAGPAIGLTLFGTVWVLFKKFHVEFLGMDIRGPELIQQLDPAQLKPWLWRGVTFLMMMTIMWNVLNLIPVIPMDGGQVVRAACRGYTSPNGLRIALIVSIAVAAGICVYSFQARSDSEMWYPDIPRWATLMPVRARMDPTFNAFFFALMGVQNLFMLFSVKRQVYSTEDEGQNPDAEKEQEETADRERELERDPYRDRVRD
jgi:Zn-dependent protease